MTTQKVHRFLSKFCRGLDIREGEIDVSHVPLTTLQRIFGEPNDELMYYSYIVDAQHVVSLQPLVSEVLDLTKYEYFLEAEID